MPTPKVPKVSDIKASVKLMLLDDIIEEYRKLNFDVGNPETEVPNTIVIDGKEHYFTADIIKCLNNKGQETHAEFVLVADAGFSWKDVEIDFDQEDED